MTTASPQGPQPGDRGGGRAPEDGETSAFAVSGDLG